MTEWKCSALRGLIDGSGKLADRLVSNQQVPHYIGLAISWLLEMLATRSPACPTMTGQVRQRLSYADRVWDGLSASVSLLRSYATLFLNHCAK